MSIAKKALVSPAGWLIFIFLGVLIVTGYGVQKASATEAVVEAGVLNVRDGPGKQYNMLDQVREGDRLPVLEQKGDWYRVRLDHGKTGWVAGWLVGLKKDVQPGSTAVVTADILNVRGEPGITAQKTGTVKEGDKLTVVESSRGWCKVKLASGETGWVAGWHLKINNEKDQNIGKSNSTGGERETKTAVVTADVLNVRSGPGLSYDRTGQVRQGDRLPFIKSSGDWYKVSLPGGGTGWVANWHVKLTGEAQDVEMPAEVTKKVVITADVLNVRSKPGTSQEVIGKVRQGEQYPLLDSSRGWSKIKLSGGSTGWVAGWLIEVRRVVDFQDGESGPAEAVVNATDVNVRGGPGTQHEVITRVNRGERMGVLEQKGSWYKVRLAQGSIGWIAEWLLSVDKAYATTPVQEEQNGDNGGNAPPGEDRDWENVDSRLAKLAVREDDGRTVVSILSDGPMRHDIFTLSDPDRLVVDLKGVTPGDLPSKIDVHSNLVSDIRSSKYSDNPDIVRLVFDVKKPVMFKDMKREVEEGTELTTEIYESSLGSLEGKVVALDPGHGGHDSGATGYSGLKEKKVNIDVALMAAHLLRKNGARVVLTRSSDKYVPLEERTKIAADAGADIFVSIHMNAHPVEFKEGTSTYYRRDNISGLGVSQADNKLLARQVQAQLLYSLNRRNVGVKQANFVVLRTATMPAALVEASFLSNQVEERLLKQDSYRARIAEAVARGVANYFTVKES